jgi:hypothetical protein
MKISRPLALLCALFIFVTLVVFVGTRAPRVGAQSASNPVVSTQFGQGPYLPTLGRFAGGKWGAFFLTVADSGRSPGFYRSTSSGWTPAQTAVTSALATTTPIDISTVSGTGIDNIVPYTPTQSSTINAASMTGTAGHYVTLVVTTSGTSSFTITFGTNFKSTGTLATGVTSAKKFTIRFISDGTNWLELSRTVAM